jgi:hypothetical protein
MTHLHPKLSREPPLNLHSLFIAQDTVIDEQLIEISVRPFPPIATTETETNTDWAPTRTPITELFAVEIVLGTAISVKCTNRDHRTASILGSVLERPGNPSTGVVSIAVCPLAQ